MTNSIGITKELSNTQFAEADFDSLIGLKFNNPYEEEAALTKVLTWELEADEDTDGFYLRFEITAEMTSQGENFVETFVIWVDDEEGEATITDQPREELTLKLDPERLDSVMDKLGL